MAHDLEIERQIGIRPTRLDAGSTSLTKREQQILDLVLEGWANKDIGIALGVGEETVKSHLSSVFNKTGFSTRSELMASMLQRRDEKALAGLLPPGGKGSAITEVAMASLYKELEGVFRQHLKRMNAEMSEVVGRHFGGETPKTLRTA